MALCIHIRLLWIFCFVISVSLTGSPGQALTEEERLKEHRLRYGNTWPPPFVPNTKGWKALMEKRMAQVAAMEDKVEKYQAWVETVPQAFTAPNLSEFGFGIARGPDELTRDLQREVIGAYKRGEASPEDSCTEAIEGPEPCLFVKRRDLTARVAQELHPYAEAWARIRLEPFTAYGFRFYQNQSVLNMHVDLAQTHVVGIVYHIEHDESSDPWPLLIEDFDGNTHQVVLRAGDVLFYESSKVLHGRPIPFNGTYYSSVFVHYYPAEGWMDVDHQQESHYAVPPSWKEIVPLKNGEPPLRLVGASFKEPSCPNSWCATTNTRHKWEGPAQDGVWIDAKGQRHPLEPKRIEE